jgi:hypothetical protein
VTFSIQETGEYPKLGDASFDQNVSILYSSVQTGIILGPVDHIGEPFEMILEGDEFFD